MSARRLLRRLRRGPMSGQALAEMALILPILLLLVFGLIEFGTAWRDYQVITNAAREGARWSVVYRVDADGKGAVVGAPARPLAPRPPPRAP